MRRGRDYRNAHEQRTGHVRTYKEGSHLQAQERGLRRHEACQHLDLALPACRTVRIVMLLKIAL